MEIRFQKAVNQFLSGTGQLQRFRPFPTAEDRPAYEQLPQELRTRIISRGEACLERPYPPIYATDFMDFHRTGNRVNYEEIYFRRRHMLNSLALAECVEGKGRFLDGIVNGIFILCEESAWQLPPHNSYRRYAPQELLPDTSRPLLDLFACETGAQLACIYYLLKVRLDEVSPYIAERISRELEQRILTPYLSEHFWWMGEGEEPMCNWTPWCTQNILLTVFLHDYSEKTKRAVLKKAAASCDFFLKDYGEDGCCDEGALYFRRAGLCLDAACDVMNQVTGGAFSSLYQWEKIRNIASYISNVHVEGKYYFNFSDCSPTAGRAGVREYLFGRRTKQPKLMRFAAIDFQTAQEELCQEELYCLSLYYRLQHAFFYRAIMAYDTTASLDHKDIFYPSNGLFITRSDVFCLAVKAGGNGDNHNHNDTGSLTLYKNGRPLLVDIGVESYTQKTFSPQRYEIWTMQSGYHNLPTLDGLDQQDGAQYHAADVIPRLGESFSSISMELAGAYPLSDKNRSYRREVSLDKEQNLVTVTDISDGGNVILNFIVYEKPTAKGNVIQTGDAALTFHGAELLIIERLPITDPRLQTAWDHDLYRIRLTMTEQRFVLQIR